MSNYEELLTEAYETYEGQQYREEYERHNEIDFESLVSAEFQHLARSQMAQGLVPTAAYVEHLLRRRTAISELLEGKEDGDFLELSDDMEHVLREEHKELTGTLVVDHMLMVAKIVNKYGPETKKNKGLFDDVMRHCMETVLRPFDAPNITCKLSTYMWVCVKNCVLGYFRDRHRHDWRCIGVEAGVVGLDSGGPGGVEAKRIAERNQLRRLNEGEKQTYLPGQTFLNNVADDEKYGPLQTLIARDKWKDLDGILDGMEEHMTAREYYVLCEWTGLGYGPDGNEAKTQAAIARELGVTNGAIGQSLRAALKKMGKVLTESGFFDKHVSIGD